MSDADSSRPTMDLEVTGGAEGNAEGVYPRPSEIILQHQPPGEPVYQLNREKILTFNVDAVAVEVNASMQDDLNAHDDNQQEFRLLNEADHDTVLSDHEGIISSRNYVHYPDGLSLEPNEEDYIQDRVCKPAPVTGAFGNHISNLLLVIAPPGPRYTKPFEPQNARHHPESSGQTKEAKQELAKAYEEIMEHAFELAQKAETRSDLYRDPNTPRTDYAGPAPFTIANSRLNPVPWNYEIAIPLLATTWPGNQAFTYLESAEIGMQTVRAFFNSTHVSGGGDPLFRKYYNEDENKDNNVVRHWSAAQTRNSMTWRRAQITHVHFIVPFDEGMRPALIEDAWKEAWDIWINPQGIPPAPNAPLKFFGRPPMIVQVPSVAYPKYDPPGTTTRALVQIRESHPLFDKWFRNPRRPNGYCKDFEKIAKRRNPKDADYPWHIPT